jgi:hypothetical protein
VEVTFFMDSFNRTKCLESPVKIWGSYVGGLAALTCLEAMVRPETGVFDGWIDLAVLIWALWGAVVGWVLSARAERKRGGDRIPGVRIAWAWFLGPMLGTAVCFGINSVLKGDIDGGMLLFYLPPLSVLLPVTVLPVWVQFSDWKRRR